MKLKFLLALFTLHTSLNSYSVEVFFYKQNSSPKYFTAETNRKGFCDEVYEQLKKRLEKKNLKITIKDNLLPIKRILQNLSGSKAGIFCGAGSNTERRKIYHYSTTPVYHVSNVVVARQDETFIPKNYKDLESSNFVVGAYHGTSSAKHLRSHENIIVNDRIYDFKTAFRLVGTKNKLKYFYYHDFGLNYLIKDSKYPLKVLPTKFRTIPQWIIFSKSMPIETYKLIDTEFTIFSKTQIFKEIQLRYFN
jgi:hypothetical protein